MKSQLWYPAIQHVNLLTSCLIEIHWGIIKLQSIRSRDKDCGLNITPLSNHLPVAPYYLPCHIECPNTVLIGKTLHLWEFVSPEESRGYYIFVIVMPHCKDFLCALYTLQLSSSPFQIRVTCLFYQGLDANQF